MDDLLDDKNFILYCAKHYLTDRHYTTEDFLEDISRIKYIKKLITRYIENNELRERLILNHIIVLNNCFGSVVTNKILYLKLKTQWKYIMPFLLFLSIHQEVIYNVGEESKVCMDYSDMDENIFGKLNKI